MIYGFSKNAKTGVCFTHVLCSDIEILNEMAETGIRYDSSFGYINTASFFHYGPDLRDQFVQKFNIVLVKTEKEFSLLRKLLIDSNN